MNKIVYNGHSYQNRTLLELDAYISDALVSDALTVDTMTAVVVDKAQKVTLLAAGGMLVSADRKLLGEIEKIDALDKRSRRGDPVWQYRGDDIYGKFYLDNVKQIGKTKYEINTISAVGLLVNDKHFGGVYNGESCGEIIADIIGERVQYTLDPALADVPVYDGWLPIASRRDNLRDVLFAVGGQIRKDSLGELNIVPMQIKEPYEISAQKIYRGGAVANGAPATEIRVTEHKYTKLETDAAETLFEGEAAGSNLTTPKGVNAFGVLIELAEPHYDYSAENASIIESGANYAVISSSPNAKLYGKKYSHIKRVIVLRQNTGREPNIWASSKCGLVSLVNAELVAERLMAYYGSGKTIETEFVATYQKPGDMVRLTDPFGDEIEGFIASMELVASAKMKAKATIISGFIPAAYGNYYSAVDVITTDGEYTVSAQCKGKIRVVLIGGGGGGHAGTKGEDGTGGGQNRAGQGGAGGQGGQGGAPGKIMVVTISAQPGDRFKRVIGSGGVGAEYNGTPSEGGDTVFGDYSTADGYSPESGYAALLTDEIYARHGEQGLTGGRGLNGTETEIVELEYAGETWTSGDTGATDTYTVGGAAAAVGGGGGGGGPAVGANGGNGGDGDAYFSVSGVYTATGGDGGKGADALMKPNTPAEPGTGGQGGHGGGGGGGGGGKKDARSDDFFAGVGGAGGNGGPGGDGAPGIILVYY